ncbi:FGF domain containing protein [Asbolus verrucosus]|uniref:FGF domain containing protein n=1 Tax=Asbolus verrucosus TaxID=1661398 RepID=A0A482VZR7_ASBVE|nr:FGF domain containing protein [Asbolus verrucosus]
MVKALFLGLLAATMCGFAAPAPQPDLPSCREDPPPPQPPPLEDPAARSERSTNLSHVTGINRKIQMYIKNRHLQLLPDGTVNGTTDDNSPYSESLLSLLTAPARCRLLTPTLGFFLDPVRGFSGTAPTNTRSN